MCQNLTKLKVEVSNNLKFVNVKVEKKLLLNCKSKCKKITLMSYFQSFLVLSTKNVKHIPISVGLLVIFMTNFM